MESDHDVINLEPHALQPYEVTMSYVGLSHLKRFFWYMPCNYHYSQKNLPSHNYVVLLLIQASLTFKVEFERTSSENTRSGLKRKNQLSPNRIQESKPTMDTSFFTILA